MSVTDSSLEVWRTSKINNGRRQIIPDKSNSLSGKITSGIQATYI